VGLVIDVFVAPLHGGVKPGAHQRPYSPDPVGFEINSRFPARIDLPLRSTSMKKRNAHLAAALDAAEKADFLDFAGCYLVILK
jgi:hypothetical protein